MAAADNKVSGGAETGESFVQRWSRRKQEARTGTLPAVEPAAGGAPSPAADPEPPRVLTDADMPPIESLGENSDYSGFFSAGVSEALRGEALRRLFTLPGIAERCPLDSEFYDCAQLEPLGNVITHEMRAALEREAAQIKEQARKVIIEPDAPPTAPKPEAGRTAEAPGVSTDDEAERHS